MDIGWFWALISPVIYGTMNVIDKYVVSWKIKFTQSFAIIAGLVNFVLGVILALFLSWDGVRAMDLLFPTIIGLFMGSTFFLYYHIMKEEDASHAIGLLYTYPILVAFLSFMFLHERISLGGYLGVMLTTLGIVFMSIRLKQLKLKASIWALVFFIVVVGMDEFFMKVAVLSLPEWNCTAVNLIAIGVFVSVGLFNKGLRKGFVYELKNIKWAVLTESFTFLGVGTMYLAMAKLPATVVSSVCAIQPLIVFFEEWVVEKRLGKMCRDHQMSSKLIPILLIVSGIALMYLS